MSTEELPGAKLRYWERTSPGLNQKHDWPAEHSSVPLPQLQVYGLRGAASRGDAWRTTQPLKLGQKHEESAACGTVLAAWNGRQSELASRLSPGGEVLFQTPVYMHYR